MEEDPQTKKWNMIAGVALITAIIIGITVGYLTEIMNGVYAFLIVTGIFMAVSFYLRDESRKSGGPSAADGAIMGGVLLCGIGICGFVHSYLNDVTITAVCIIAVLIASSAVMIVRNRRFL